MSCSYLRCHASGPGETSRASLCKAVYGIVKLIDLRYEPCVFVASRIIGIETVYVREEYQKIRIYQSSHNCRKSIVIAELYLIRGYRIVLIHYGYDPELQQLFEGVPCIEAIYIIHYGELGHEDLGRHLIVFREELLIHHHKSRLTYGCSCLLELQLLIGTLAPAGTAVIYSPYIGSLEPYRDGSRRHQHHIPAAVVQVGKLSDQLLQPDKVRSAGLLMCDGRGAYLDHYAFFITEISHL